MRYSDKYYDDDSHLDKECSKCGSRNVSFEYHSSCVSNSYGEHLHYSCGRCGYAWTGSTLDKKEKSAR